ncbi:MAG: carbonic anhydrase [Gammaproteobacteria bacterium]|nr:MAG: carbonic anhydrase [Gammaproteobacteria bacterium]
MTTTIEALKRLKAGNQRFVEGNLQHRTLDEYNKSKMTGQQQPFAIILGCSDSRAPAEMVFDQGIGDLFVIRVAGNIVAPSLVGSIEYAVQQFGTPLVVVLGHSHCGAVTACVEQIQRDTPQNAGSHNLYSIVERIRPAIHTLAETPIGDDKDLLVQHGVRANVRASVANLRYSSPTLEKYIGYDELLIVGAVLDLETGQVDFFEGLPQTGMETVSFSE